MTEDSAVCTATYLLSAPDGEWETFDNGDYRVSLQSSQVADSSFNWTPTTSLGTFNVDTTPGLIRVTSFDDGLEAGTLRAAVIASNTDTATENVIRLSTGQYTLSISGREEDAAATGDLDVTYNVTIRGAGADVTTIDAAALDRVFHVLSGVTVELQDVTLTGGDPQAAGGGILNEGTLTLTRCQVSASTATDGGALSNASGAVATINASTLYDNSAENGGALDNQGTLTLVNSTISGNEATAGGGIRNQSGTALLTNTTIAANTAATGGGIANSATATLLNTITAANTASTDPDFSGTVDSSGTNLIGQLGASTGWRADDLVDTDPLLGPLQNNTGPTLTHALQLNSPAIDAGTDAGVSNEDQRGIARPQDGNNDDTPTIDIGAVERYFGEVHGVLFQDDDPNGIRQLREPGLPGKTVYLDINDNGLIDPGEPLSVTAEDDPGTVGVDEAGFYSFYSVPPGSHRVMPLLEQGWEQTLREPRVRMERVSNGWEVVEVETNDGGLNPSISADGRYVAFVSYASNLVPGDTNGSNDIFVHDCPAGTTERVSVASDGTQANALSYHISVSSDGRYVAFVSEAWNLVPGDTNWVSDIFVHDRQSGTTERVSVASDGTQADRSSVYTSISADGRYVAFMSDASNLVPGDTNGWEDIFVHDRQTGITERVSVASDGTQTDSDSFCPSISADGRYVAFVSEAWNLVPGDTNWVSDIFVHDRQTGTVERMSVASNSTEANEYSDYPSISADGRYVAFMSYASNLVPGDTNWGSDIFVHDRQSGSTERASVASDGTQANYDSESPSISADGRYVAFQSNASSLVPGDTNGTDIFVYDRQSGTTARVSVASDGTQADYGSERPSISADGRYVAFESAASNLVSGDTNGVRDIFVHDGQAGTTERVSVALEGTEANDYSDDTSISADGRYAAFESYASNLVPGDTNGVRDIFVYDRQSGTTERVSVAFEGTEANDYSDGPSISADGRYVAFESAASNLVPGDTNEVRDIFVYDRQSGTTERVSVAYDSTETNDFSGAPSISADGRYVAFVSAASNLVPGDTNGTGDIFVHDRQLGTTERVSVASDSTQAASSSSQLSISADGRYVAFMSRASNLVLGDTNGSYDIFVHDRQTGITERVSVTSDGTQADYSSYNPSISADGRYVAFWSPASNLVPGDTNEARDIFLHDRQTGITERVSVASDGTQADYHSGYPSISADGRYVAFESGASNLVPGDTNGWEDIFVHDRQLGTTERVSVASNGTQADNCSEGPSISADGSYVAFMSYASNLVPDEDTNEEDDIFVAVNLPAWQAASVAVNVAAGESVAEMELSICPLPGEIHGCEFDDRNRNGIRDTGEPGLAGWTIYLDSNDNGTFNAGEPSTLTGSYGEYSFSDLEPFKSYTVAALPQQYWVQTLPTQTAGGTWTAEINAGTLVDDIDFGNYYAGPDAQSTDVVTGVLYHDLNANGLQDDNEPGLGGWTVELNSEDGQIQDTDTTDASGRYSFEGVTVRNYAVQLQAQTGWTLTTPLENSLSATSFGQGQFDQTQAVATGDFDGDSDQDMAVTHGEYVTLLRNVAGGVFETWQEIHVGSGAGALEVGDFNNDGDADLAVVCFNASTLSVLLNQGTPLTPFGSAVITEVGSLPRSLAVGLFNDDDHLDVAIAHENGYSDVYVNDNQVSVLRGNGDGSFQPATYLAAGDSPVVIIAGQFTDDDHDGWINDRDATDLAVANLDSNDVTVLFNNGSGSFNAGVPIPVSDAVGGIPISFATADLDRDGDLDLAVADLASDSISILFNLGNGSFVRLPDALSAGTGVQAVISVDLEGDGDFDLVVTNNTAEHLGILRNFTDPTTGVIEFAPLESFGVANFSGGPSYSVIAEHLDGDADIDLAVAIGETDLRLDGGSSDAPQNYVSVLLNDVFQGAHHITVTGTEEVPELNFGVRPEGNLPAVVGRYIFYNNSYYDGDDPAANANDDTAIATDKVALQPGELATFANYTSYTRGINGVMIDVADAAGTATLDDFAFQVGNSSDLRDWTTLEAPNLPTVTVRAGAGVGGSDRITLAWPDNTIEQQWLQVTVLAGGNLGLVADDVFYFGNAIGDSGEGNPSGVATAFISDELGARNNPHTFLDRAPVDDAYDYNRDSIVFISDELIARNNQTNFLTGLKLITAPASAPLAMSAAYVESDEIAEATQSQQAEVDEYVDASMEETDAAWIYYDWFDELDRANDDHDEDTEESGLLVDTLAMLAEDTRS